MADIQITTLGAGCFWCVEAIFNSVRGVISAVSGYAGGAVQNPTYKQVCNGNTGHAEVVQVKFDPAIVSFEDLLFIFWRVHDPTTLNRQGHDVGTQYRSVIFYHTETQRLAAEKSKMEANAAGLYPNPLVTEITAFTNFYAAEDYHQDYFAHNPNQPYCQAVVDPKVQKFRKSFKEKLKS